MCFVPAVGLWFVTRWADVEYAASHPELIDSAVTPSPLDRVMGGKSILVLDGEPQRRLRAMLDPSLRPRVVEATTPELVAPIVERLLDAIAPRGEAELMSEYFEPVSVLSLGQILGLGEIDGDTLRRWFHGLAEGAINFEDDAARWAVSDAIGAEIDRELGPVLEGLFESPDSSTIATMLQHAEGTLAERVAGDPADAEGDPARRDAGARARCRVDGGGTARVRPGSRPRRRARRARSGRGRGGPAVGVSDRDADPTRPRRRGARRHDDPGGLEPRCPRRLGQPRRGGVGPDRRRLRPASPEAGPRGVRLRTALLLRPPFLTRADADRGPAALRTAPEPAGAIRTGRPLFNGWEFRAPQHLHVRWDP